MTHIGRNGLIVIALFMGFSASMIQVLLIREILNLCRGNELIIGMIFASWFLGIYAGARFKPSDERRILERRVLCSMFLLPVLSVISIYSALMVQLFIPRLTGTFYSFSTELLFALIFTLPAGFFVGFFFPPLVSLISLEIKEKSGAAIYYFESIGSFAGGIIFSFILVELVNPLFIIFMLLFLAIAFISFYKKRALLPLAVIPLILIIYSNKIESKVFAYVWDKVHTGKLIKYQRTKYGLISVQSSGDMLSVFNDGILLYSIPDTYEARGIFHLIRSLRRGHNKIALIGSGPGSLLNNLLRTDIEKLYYFESDPELWQLLLPFVQKFYTGYDNIKLNVSHQDFKHFLKTNKNGQLKFDMIICLAPQPDNIMLNRFYTKEFYSLCKEHLSDRGIIIAGMAGFGNYISNEFRDYIASIYSAFINEFPLNMKTSGETMYMIGARTKGILPENTNSLIAGYVKSIQADNIKYEKEIVENFSPDELQMFFETTQIKYFDEVIVPHIDNVNPNSDMKPEAHWKNIVFDAFREQSLLYTATRYYVLIPIIALFLMGVTFGGIRRKYGPFSVRAGLLAYLTGFISISTMLILVLLYQNSQGIVYYRLALINAIFMLGLASGSFVFNRKQILKLPYIFIAIGFALITILVIALLELQFLFWIIVFIFSFLCGAVFPTLFTLNKNRDYYNKASLLDSMDHSGAITGSLLTVMFFIPVLGILATIIINMILIAFSFITGYKILKD